jgi:hypothetical protein
LLAVVVHKAMKKKTYKLFNRKISRYHTVLFLSMVAAGWVVHILLDGFLGGPELLSWIPIIAPITSLPSITLDVHQAAALDATILILWLIHEEVAHKIKDYI